MTRPPYDVSMTSPYSLGFYGQFHAKLNNFKAHTSIIGIGLTNRCHQLKLVHEDTFHQNFKQQNTLSFMYKFDGMMFV